MTIQEHPRVAVLLATYNGSQYVESQIRSLRKNTTEFTLHWLDDQSSDDTRNIVRASAHDEEIPVCEWHNPQRQGVPGAFFQLLDCVEADIYLFCDQDDIWQPHKIDATVANLLPDVASPVLCFSDPLLFYDDEPGVFRRMSELLHIKSSANLNGSRSLMATLTAGQAVGLTRPLRDMFLRHKDIAREHAHMHDWWMCLLANASGTSRLLADVPTTLYRQHGNNVTHAFFSRTRGIDRLVSTWRLQHRWRRLISRQARGFILASPTLPQGPKLEPLVAVAHLIATLDRRQSPAALVRLARRGAIVPSWYRMFWLTASCLLSDAKP
jgi:glycosyltransferase involved in cell wall biosynthesis